MCGIQDASQGFGLSSGVPVEPFTQLGQAARASRLGAIPVDHLGRGTGFLGPGDKSCFIFR